MDHRAGAVLVAAVVLVAGCAGAAPGATTDTTTPTAEPTETPRPTTDAPEASFTQTPHTGCQPGAIEVDGTCEVAAAGQNAEIFSTENLSAVTTERTTVGGAPGYLARPADDGTYPSVVMIHEWWGLNENIERMAEILAGHGYVVFAVDLYDGEVATNSTEAGRLSGQVRDNPDEAVATMSGAVAGLRERSDTTDRVASLGWCFGGGQSLQLSLSDADLNATVVYYGTLATDADTLQRVDGPVLGVFGSEDRVVPVEDVRTFDRTLGEVGVEREVYVYDGAGHAFANPSGESFRPNATRDAWTKTLDFLDRNLKEE
jgi:carboxymethylenebutenolidase